MLIELKQFIKDLKGQCNLMNCRQFYAFLPLLKSNKLIIIPDNADLKKILIILSKEGDAVERF